MFSKSKLKIGALVLAMSAAAAGAAWSQQAGGARWPMSDLLTPEARQALAPPTEGPGSQAAARLPTEQEVGIAELRRLMGPNLQPNVDRMIAAYPVDIQETTMGGISVAVITPRGGVPERNRNRVMINAPGGGFRTGIRANGLMVSIPVASIGQMKVITILYRQGPEHRFPAATEDFTAVYREVLKTNQPQNIGVFGCSAGGALVGQSVAHFIKAGIPKPAVMGVYCAGLASGGGDSALVAAASGGQPVPQTFNDMGGMGGGGPDGYYAGMDTRNPDITPANDPALLAQFPPVFLLTATRDFAMSNALLTHRRLLAAGVESQLVVMDGLGHGFMTNARLPETREGQTLAVEFYDKHLGR